MRLAIFLLALPAFGQLAVTATPAAPDVVKAFLEHSIDGVQAFTITACVPLGSPARDLGGPDYPGSRGKGRVGRSWAQVTADIAEGVTLGGAVVTGGELIGHTDQGEVARRLAVRLGAQNA